MVRVFRPIYRKLRRLAQVSENLLPPLNFLLSKAYTYLRFATILKRISGTHVCSASLSHVLGWSTKVAKTEKHNATKLGKTTISPCCKESWSASLNHVSLIYSFCFLLIFPPSCLLPHNISKKAQQNIKTEPIATGYVVFVDIFFFVMLLCRAFCLDFIRRRSKGGERRNQRDVVQWRTARSHTLCRRVTCSVMPFLLLNLLGEPEGCRNYLLPLCVGSVGGVWM